LFLVNVCGACDVGAWRLSGKSRVREFLCRLYLHSIHACKRCVERGQSSVPYYRAKRVRVGTDEGASLARDVGHPIA
jgi:hypothetical protein